MKLLPKYIFEEFNPVLDGGFIAPNLSNNVGCTDDIIEPSQTISNNTEVVTPDNPTILGNTVSFGNYIINGEPITAWTAQTGGGVSRYNDKQVQNRLMQLQQLQNQLFPNGITLINDIDFDSIDITDIKILKMNKEISSGFILYVSFKLNNNEIWIKVYNVGVSKKWDIISVDLKNMSKEIYLKVTGNVVNKIKNWFKITPGIYRCLADDFFVYSMFGEIKKLERGNIVEVVWSDDVKLKIIINNNEYIIKYPEYYWFNWIFEEIKK